MAHSSPSNMTTTRRAFVSHRRRQDGSPTFRKAKPPLSPTSPVARRINPALLNSLPWSPTASQYRRPVDTEDYYWLVEDSNEDEWNFNKSPVTRRHFPMALTIPSGEQTRGNESDEDIKRCSLQPRIERDNSGLFGLDFLEDDLP